MIRNDCKGPNGFITFTKKKDCKGHDDAITYAVKAYLKACLKPSKSVEEKTEDISTKQVIKTEDPLAYALKGMLNHGDIVEYGYQIKEGNPIPLEWLYVEIDGEKHFVCRDIVGRMPFKEKSYENYISAEDKIKKDLEFALYHNAFNLYTDSKSSLGKDNRIDGGLTILSKDKYLKINKILPKTDIACWLLNKDYYNIPRCVADSCGSIKYTSASYLPLGIRPAFRLKPEC